MIPSKCLSIGMWVAGLIVFALIVYLHAPLAIAAVPGGISEHQAAPDAATVNAIQNAWAQAGLLDQAAIAMIGDLIFIGIYGAGCVLTGLHFRARGCRVLRMLGRLTLWSGAIFLFTDYAETICQFIQLMQAAGNDRLAAIASGVRPVKMLSFIAAFFAVIAALIADWRARSV
ncbi:MAG: hypothetical protein AAGL10_03420 [Pseudomonadota bacterium]